MAKAMVACLHYHVSRATARRLLVLCVWAMQESMRLNDSLGADVAQMQSDIQHVATVRWGVALMQLCSDGQCSDWLRDSAVTGSEAVQ